MLRKQFMFFRRVAGCFCFFFLPGCLYFIFFRQITGCHSLCLDAKKVTKEMSDSEFMNTIEKTNMNVNKNQARPTGVSRRGCRKNG